MRWEHKLFQKWLASKEDVPAATLVAINGCSCIDAKFWLIDGR